MISWEKQEEIVMRKMIKSLFCCNFSEFADIFDLEHFKDVLADDVHIVSSLPSTHVMTRPVEEKRTPLHASPQWIRAHYLKRVRFLTKTIPF